MSANQSIKDGQSIASARGRFEMGFFSPGRSAMRYLGLWYKWVATGTVVWIANRDNPIEDKLGVLKLTNNGNLIILNRRGGIIWSSNFSGATNSPFVQLLDTGNLVVKDGNQENFLWQSFDYPTDTFLSGMKIGYDKRRGLNQYLTSWKSKDDPSRGDIKLGLDPHGYPHFFLKNGSVDKFRLGPWNDLGFSGQPIIKSGAGLTTTTFVVDEEEAYYKQEINSNYELIAARSVVAQSGNSQA